jgi:hypothetical protein
MKVRSGRSELFDCPGRLEKAGAERGHIFSTITVAQSGSTGLDIWLVRHRQRRTDYVVHKLGLALRLAKQGRGGHLGRGGAPGVALRPPIDTSLCGRRRGSIGILRGGIVELLVAQIPPDGAARRIGGCRRRG